MAIHHQVSSSVPLKGEFYFYVSELIQQRQIFVKPPDSEEWGFHLVLSPAAKMVSIGIAGPAPFISSGCFIFNGRIAQVSSVINNENGIRTFGVCDFFNLSEINGYLGKVTYDLLMSFSKVPQSSQPIINNNVTVSRNSEVDCLYEDDFVILIISIILILYI